jgi:GMP synthase (glutamine-hydrolysing)
MNSVLIVNTCRNEDVLTEREFVWPIQRALHVPSKVVHLSKLTEAMANDFDAVIFSGCPYGDDAYLKKTKNVKWVTETKKPLLGVCAGQHLIAAAFGGEVKQMPKAVIGVEKIMVVKGKKEMSTILDTFVRSPNAYFLHHNQIPLPARFVSLARSRFSQNEIIVHEKKPIVGVSFHPEVLNKDFFSAFLKWAESRR